MQLPAISLYLFMKKIFSLFLSFSFFISAFAEDIAQNTQPFKNAPWCSMPCGRIHLIVWLTLLGTIGLQILMLVLFPKMKKLKKRYKWTIYGVVTLASIAVAAYILPPYLQDGFVIGRCFIGDPMGCQ